MYCNYRVKASMALFQKTSTALAAALATVRLNQRPFSMSWSICSIECGEIPSSRNPGISGIDALLIRISFT